MPKENDNVNIKIVNVTKKNGIPSLECNSLVKNRTNQSPILIAESFAAQRLSETLKGFFAYDARLQQWYKFTGNHWSPLESPEQVDEQVTRLLRIGSGELGYRQTYKKGVKSGLEEAGDLPLPKTDNSKLPFKNGLLDIKTRQLEPITPSNAYTWCIPYEYKANTDCPAIKEWLLLAVDGDKETVRFLRAFMAAVLHGRADLQKFLHLKGAGGTGKGAFMRLLEALVGEQNTAITELGQLEKSRFETASLCNKRLALISESDKYGGSINNLKAITGQDSIRLERKYQQASNFVFQGLVVIASNESLQVTDHTSGLDRRRITVIFNRRATDKEKLAWKAQGGEAAVLHTELPGLVNWLIELPQTEISQIIQNPPDRVKRADLDAMTDTNPIADWLIENCEPSLETWTQIGDKREIKAQGEEVKYECADEWLYANYLQYSQRANKSALSINRFRQILIQTCETLSWSVSTSRRVKGVGVTGLRLKQQGIDEYAARYKNKGDLFPI